MNRLKELRKKQRLTQQEIANYVGISQNNYSYWENEKVKIDNISLKKLADFYKVTVDYILCRTDTPNIENVPSASTPSPAPNTVIAFGRGGERKEFVLNDAEADAVTAMLEALRIKKN